MAATVHFDPDRLAYFESAGWRAYYDRQWLWVLRLMARLVGEQLDIPIHRSFLAASYVTRAAIAWAPIEHDEDKSLRFTKPGLDQAEAIVGRHRLIERFLTDVVGIAWDDVHEEAERLEHAMSPAFEKWMISAVGNAKTCPHGPPIEPGNRVPGVPLADVEVGAEVEILRFENEAEDLLHYLKRVGLQPGLKGTLTSSDADEVALRSNGDVIALTRSVAETVSVRADPSPPPRTALPDQLVLGKERYGR